MAQPRVFRSIRIIVASLVVATVSSATAVEPAREFLEGLRQRGYHDYALLYLERMRTSPLATPEFKETLGYELGVTLRDGARLLPTPKQREEQLDRARDELAKFIKDRPKNPRVMDAWSQLGQLGQIRARMRFADMERPRADTKKLGQEALGFLADAKTAYEARLKLIETQLEGFKAQKKQKPLNPKIKADAEKLRDEQRLLGEKLLTRLFLADISYEQARAHPAGSAEHKKQLLASAKEFEKIYDENKNSVGGAYARMYQARSMHDAGSSKEAATLLEDCLGRENEPDEFRVMKTKAFKLACEVWLTKVVGKRDSVLERGVEWLALARPDDVRDPDWLGLRYVIASAYEQAMKEGKLAANTMATYRESALRQARMAARYPHPLQDDAKSLIARLATGKDGGAESDPTTFAAAMERADDERELMASKELIGHKLKERLATEKLSNEEKADIKKQFDEAEKAVPVHRRNAIRLYALAIRLAPELTRAEIRTASAGPKTKPKGKAALSSDSNDGQKQLDELNRARYYYAWLCLQDGRNHEAAVAGRFLAENYPTGLIGRGAAQVAMIAWSRLYNEAKGSKAFETAGLQGVLTLITERYPDPETSASAYILLAKIMARQGQFKEAVDILKKAPKESVQVPGAQVEIGQLIIKEYFASKRLPKEQQPSADDSKWMIDTSKSLITEGMKNLEGTGRIDASLVSAAYAVAQLYADLSDAKQALSVIEHAKYGPLTLVTKKDPVVQPPNFKPEFVHNVYKLSLRVFLSLADKQPEMLTRAEQTLATLEKLVSPEQLSTFYKQMAGEFQTQLENAEPGERAALSKGFTRFLRKIRDGKDSEQYNTLAYVFSQFMGVADSLYKEGEKPTAEAREYYSDAAKTGEKILKLSEGGKIEIKPANLMAVKVEIAKALAKTGEFEKAIESIVSILTEKPNTLGVQIEAARIYELWGAEDPKYYKHAIGGGAWNKETGRFTIWGWNGIVQRVSRNPKLREVYYEAVLQAANCQYRLSQSSQAEAEKKKYAEMSKRTILRLAQGHPELGGPKMKTRFDGLLRQVQKQLNESPVGLPAATAVAG
jgi:hypothetical protein